MSNLATLFTALLTISLIISSGCSEDKSRRIKLAGSEDIIKTSGRAGTTVLQISPEEQKSLVMRHFKNHSGDASLDWLERGLPDMLSTELSQSPYLKIITEAQFLDIAQKMGKTGKELDDRLVEILIAGKAKAQILLTGHISYQNERIIILVEATDAVTGIELRKEKVEGKGLEKLFSMVDELSGRLRQFLREKDEQQKYASITLSEMTTSVEAFRCYSKALENSEKYLFVAAEECLEEALKYDSTFAAAYLGLLAVKNSLKKSVNHEELIAKTKKYAYKLSDADKVKLELIENQMQGEQLKIISILEDAVRRHPMDLDLRFNLAQNYRMWGHEEKAVQEYEEILEMDPNRKVVYNDLGYLYADMGDFKTALYMLDKYQKLAPDEPNPHDSKGEILVLAGRLHEAAEEYKQALKIMPAYYSSAFRLSEIYTEVGDQEKALKYLDHGLQYVPDTGFEMGADYSRARIYWRFGDFAQADKYFKKLLTKNPLSSGVLIRQMEMYRSAGKNKQANKIESEAFEQFKTVLEKSPDSYKYIRPFMEFVLYSDLEFDRIVPVLEKALAENKISELDINMGYAVDFCKLYRGETNKAMISFKKKIPLLLEGVKVKKNVIGWASTWKNLFLFFGDKNVGSQMSQIFADNISDLLKKDSRKDLEFIATMAQARAFGVESKKDQYTKLYEKFGVPTEETWKFCGPFREYQASGFEKVFPPENEIKLNATYTSNNKEIKWVTGSDAHRDGHFNLCDLYDQNSFVAAYGLVYINSPDERTVQVRIGSDEGCKFWLNDEFIWQHYIRKDAVIDRDIVTVVLHPGYNKMLLKITNTDLDWGFYFRVTDEAGDGFPDLKFVSAEEIESSLAINN